MIAARLRFALFAAVLCSVVCGVACAQDGTDAPARLDLTGEPQLVDCAPVSPVPCMAAEVTPVTAAGKPAPMSIPAASLLAGRFSLQSAAGDVQPFYASSGAGPDAGQHANVVLMLVDISGSMDQKVASGKTRFEELKDAVTTYLSNMQGGVDYVAIVPFESHNVVSTIHAAVFTPHKSDALEQLQSLPAPAPDHNTALYQAVFTGVETMRNELHALEQNGPSQVQGHVVVMTDGRNEVGAKDDPQMLNGSLGLQQAIEQVHTSHLDVIGIGFGDQKDIDPALEKLSSRFFYAADASGLLHALHMSRSETSHAIRLTWQLPASNRLALAGHDQAWTPVMKLDSGATISGGSIGLVMPALSAPVFDRVASREELDALINLHPPSDSGWSAVLLHGLLYLLAAALLLVLWFWVPRLVWGERYGKEITGNPRRWDSPERPGVMSASGVQVRSSAMPAGFSAQMVAQAPLQRSAAQTTQIQPRSEGSRTRLTFQ